MGLIEVFCGVSLVEPEIKQALRGRLQPSEPARRQNSTTELLGPGIELGLKFLERGLNRHRNARLVVCLGHFLCTGMKRGLDAPESDGVSHRGLAEVGQDFALSEH